MADQAVSEETAADQQQENNQKPEETSSQEITPVSLDEMVKNRDLNAMRDAGKKLFDTQVESPEALVPEPEPSEQKRDESAAKDSAEKQEAALFKYRYRGEERAVPDDGLLGYETTGHLKRAKLHADAHITDLENSLDQYRAKMQLTAKENEELRRKLDSLRQKPEPLKTPPPVPQPEQPKPLEMLQPPQMPALSTNDPIDYTDDDKAKMADYYAKTAEFNSKLVQHLQTREPEVRFDVPEDVKVRLAALEEQNRQSNAVLSKIHETNKIEIDEAADRAYWETVGSFQGQRKEFKTETPIRDLHAKVDKWMTRLAEANGAVYGTSEFADQKAIITGRFLNGDNEVIDKSEGITPPDEYETYFKLANLQKKRDDLIEKGELGKNSTLYQAYLFDLDSSGQLDSDINEVVAEARKEGLQAVGAALEQKEQFAQPIPNDLGAESAPLEISKQDVEWMLKVSPRELAADPKLKQRYIELNTKFIQAQTGG